MAAKLSLAILVVAALSGSRVSAHHAFSAEFDAKQPVTLTGTVTKIEMVNPHGWIHIDVKGPSGRMTTWKIETGTPNSLARRGITKNLLPIGQTVIVTGYRAKDMSSTAAGERIKFPDGRSFSVGGSAEQGFPVKK
jgi:Family of unknown function (DUF6152)